MWKWKHTSSPSAHKIKQTPKQTNNTSSTNIKIDSEQEDMSLRFLNSPPIVAAAGGALAMGLPMLDALISSSASLTLLKALNAAAFATNVIAVSIPGRLDGPQDDEMRKVSTLSLLPSARLSLSVYHGHLVCWCGTSLLSYWRNRL